MNTEEDEEVNEIMSKMQHLQEVRYKRMCNWCNLSVGDGNHQIQEQTDRTIGTNIKQQQKTPSPNGLIQRLRNELVSLLSQDDAIFRQLLILRRSINQIKQQQQQQGYYCTEEDDEEEEVDIEMSYLSSSSSIGTVADRCERHNSGGETDFELRPFFTSSRYVPCEHNVNNSSEDSAISLESSNLSSMPNSLAPSPTNDTSAAASDDIQPSTFHRHNVTYPPSRNNRHSRFNDRFRLLEEEDNNLAKSRTMSIPSGVESLGRRTIDRHVCDDESKVSEHSVMSNGKARKTVSPLVQMLVRSRSITFLPRGALIRREESCDSGFHGSAPKAAGEIFV